MKISSYNVQGSFHTSIYNGQRFFLTLVDHSCFTQVCMLSHKSEAPSIIKRFFPLVETQFHKVIKAFRTDNARELQLIDCLVDKGVLHQFSSVELLKQNVMIECKHQHQLNMARSLYFQAKLPLVFQDDCVWTSTLLINRILIPILQRTIIHIWFFLAKIQITQV